MPKGKGSYEYILHAQEDLAAWPEARASRKNDSKSWATFIYEDLLCHFGCSMIFVCDNGPEFKGATSILMAKYKIPCILVSPYHPQANLVVERLHRTLVNCLLKTCHKRENEWPTYLSAVLLAIRTTTTRTTGYTPYYLLYGQHPVFPWSNDDPTWQHL